MNAVSIEAPSPGFVKQGRIQPSDLNLHFAKLAVRKTVFLQEAGHSRPLSLGCDPS